MEMQTKCLHHNLDPSWLRQPTCLSGHTDGTSVLAPGVQKDMLSKIKSVFLSFCYL